MEAHPKPPNTNVPADRATGASVEGGASAGATEAQVGEVTPALPQLRKRRGDPAVPPRRAWVQERLSTKHRAPGPQTAGYINDVYLQNTGRSLTFPARGIFNDLERYIVGEGD